MKKPIPRGVVFDLDGTLLDSPAQTVPRLKILAKRNGLPFTEETEAYINNMLGLAGGPQFLAEAFQVSHAKATEMCSAWEHMDITHPAPLITGAVETLNWARTQGMTLGILTNRGRKTTLPILERNNLHEGYFACIITHDEMPHLKPDHRSFVPVFENLCWYDVRRQDMLFVGDTWADMAAGKGADVETVMVRSAHCDINLRRHHVPETHIIDSVAELPQWIEERQS